MFNVPHYDEDDDFFIIIPPEEPEADDGETIDNGWTARRVLFLVIALIAILAVLIAYFVMPFMQATGFGLPPTPTPLPPPGSVL